MRPLSDSVEETLSTENMEDLSNAPAYNELYQTFSAAIAHHAFLPLCGIMGSKYMEGALLNHDLIWNLCCTYDAQLSHPACEDTRVSEEEEDGEESADHLVMTEAMDAAAGSNTQGLDTGETGSSRAVKETQTLRKRSKPPVWRISRKFSKTKDEPTVL